MKKHILKDVTAMLIVIVVFVCQISACATAPPPPAKQWYKPSFTQEEWAKDKYDCLQQAQQTKASSTGATGFGIFYEPGHSQSDVITNWDLFNACMEARGWSLR